MTPEPDCRHPEEEPGEQALEPQVYTVKRGLHGWSFSRRAFLAAAAATVTGGVAAAQPPEPAAQPPEPQEEPTLEPVSYLPIVNGNPLGQSGEVPPGQIGGQVVGPGGEVRWVPCGTPIPPEWICTCNCVAAPPLCTCQGHCVCEGHCAVDTHYWYPN